MVTPAGFEPATIRLEGGCSIQLSYGAIGVLLGESTGIEKWKLANSFEEVSDRIRRALLYRH